MTAIVPFPAASTATSAMGRATSGALADRLADWVDPDPDASASDVAFRQLRHQTKNALQRILCHVATQPGLAETPGGRALARDLERRIQLVAAISDALFGFTRAPDPLPQRLDSLGRSVVELMCDPGQLISFDVRAEGSCPKYLDEIVVRVAHELIGNAVKHGMHVRLVGAIEVAVRTTGAMTVLTVSDDGWGYSETSQSGEGLAVVSTLADPYGGTLQMRRDRDRTHVSLSLPHIAARGAPPRHGLS